MVIGAACGGALSDTPKWPYESASRASPTELADDLAHARWLPIGVLLEGLEETPPPKSAG
jgi:hypothetical protein